MFTRKDFRLKYKDFIKLMAIEKDVDLGVAEDMLIAHANNRIYTNEELNELNPYISAEELRYNFDGSENLDYIELDKDIDMLNEYAKQLRKEKGL